MTELYTLLGVAPTASPEEIEAAYQARLAEYALPDDAPADMRALADERRRRVQDAYAALLQPQPIKGLSRREWLWMLAGVLVAIVIITSVAVLSGESEATPDLAVVDRPAPDLALKTLDGGTIRLADFRGKVVLINFWSTTCEPCKYETPDLIQAYTDFKDDGLEIIGVNLTDQEPDLATVQQFVQEYGVNYPIALDDAHQWQDAFGVYWIPHSFFVDPNGRIRYTRVNVVSRSDIERVLQELKPQPNTSLLNAQK